MSKNTILKLNAKRIFTIPSVGKFSYHYYYAIIYNFSLPHVAESVSISSEDEAGGTKQAASETVEGASKYIM